MIELSDNDIKMFDRQTERMYPEPEPFEVIRELIQEGYPLGEEWDYETDEEMREAVEKAIDRLEYALEEMER